MEESRVMNIVGVSNVVIVVGILFVVLPFKVGGGFCIIL